VQRRPIYKAQPSCGWRALLLRARSPRLYHTSYPVRVPRPAPSFHAAFRPHLTVTPLRFPCPSAPRIPGQGTFTPEHDSMHGTHARPEPRAPTRRLRAVVELSALRSLKTTQVSVFGAISGLVGLGVGRDGPLAPQGQRAMEVASSQADEGNPARTPGDAMEAGTCRDRSGRSTLPPPPPPAGRRLLAVRGSPQRA
jgi:hypothetical protein